MSPEIRNIQPTHGTLKRDSFAIHFISRGSFDRSRMSSSDWWFATTT